LADFALSGVAAVDRPLSLHDALPISAAAGATSAWAGPPALAGVVSCAQPAAARARIIAAASFPLCSIGTTPLWKVGNPAITGHGRQGFADEPHGGRPDASGARTRSRRRQAQ